MIFLATLLASIFSDSFGLALSKKCLKDLEKISCYLYAVLIFTRNALVTKRKSNQGLF